MNQAQSMVAQTQQIAQARLDAVHSEAQAVVSQLLQVQNSVLQAQNTQLSARSRALTMKIKQEELSASLRQQLMTSKG